MAFKPKHTETKSYHREDENLKKIKNFLRKLQKIEAKISSILVRAKYKHKMLPFLVLSDLQDELKTIFGSKRLKEEYKDLNLSDQYLLVKYYNEYKNLFSQILKIERKKND